MSNTKHPLIQLVDAINANGGKVRNFPGLPQDEMQELFDDITEFTDETIGGHLLVTGKVKPSENLTNLGTLSGFLSYNVDFLTSVAQEMQDVNAGISMVLSLFNKAEILSENSIQNYAKMVAALEKIQSQTNQAIVSVRSVGKKLN